MKSKYNRNGKTTDKMDSNIPRKNNLVKNFGFLILSGLMVLSLSGCVSAAIIYVDNELNFNIHDLNKNVINYFFKKVNQGLKIKNIDNYDLDINFFKESSSIIF